MDYCVIFDAEDMPEPLQLKKAVLAFDKADENTACIQAKLNFYNPSQNLLTKLFTAEYSLWFELVLTGLQSINAPIPLGGTSNHFRTQDLRKLHGWDSFNVTEDADLGIRIAKAGYTTAIVDSETLEEANSNLTNWFWQRSRWIKGYIQTYFLHMRRPGEFLQKGRTWNLFTFQLVIGGKVLSMLINPVMWTITICYFVLRAKYGLFIQSFFPSPILYMGVVSWIFGNFLYLYYYMLGCAKHKHYFLIPYVVFVPFYWLGMSMAMYMAVWKFMISPHQWSKTKHGLHLDSHATDDSVMEVHAPTTLFAKLITLSELLSLEKLCVYLSALLSSIAIFISYRHNWILAYGDAESHINIAKKVVSALTPGFAQLGGIWLPLPHLFMLPFMFFDPLWKTGLGGSIVSGIAFIIAGLFLYKTIFLVTKNRLGSFLGYLVFAVNFNVLYMQSTPMSELTLIAFLILSTYYFIRYLYVSDGLSYLLLSAFFSFCATLSRYDAWFLILFQAGIILLLALKHASTRQKRLGEFFTFSTLAFFGVLLWLAWGWLILGDPFYFTNSQYSAHAQQLGWFARNELPAYHQVLASFSYYAVTSVFTIGTIISTVALFSLYVFLFDEKIRYRGFILLILFVPFLFNAFSLYMGQAVIFIPILTPKTYEYTLFNVRYGMLMIAVAGFLYGYLVYKVPSFFKLLLFLGILFQTSLFLTHSFPVITLDDGTHGLSASKTPLNVEHFINTHYTKGLVLIDDYARTISIAKSTIPMNSIIYVGTKPYWNESIAHPEKYATWIIMQKDDAVWTGIYTDDARKAELYKYFNKVYTSNSILVFERMKPEAPVIGKE